MDPNDHHHSHHDRGGANAPMTQPLQPLLHDSVVLLTAPSQAWSAADGTVDGSGIHGFYHSDLRVLDRIVLTIGGDQPEHIATAGPDAATAVFTALARRIDDATADPRQGEAPIPAAPCSGPGCSSRDSAPASTATVDNDCHDRWGEFGLLAFAPHASCWTPSIEAPTARPIVTKPSIFHPPPRLLINTRPSLFVLRGR